MIPGNNLLKIVLFLFPLINTAVFQEIDNLIALNPDQLGQSTFFISKSNPYLFEDVEFRTLQFDGNFRTPIGSYLFYDAITEFKKDTSTTTYFHWRQGDYQFRNIQIGFIGKDLKNNSIDFTGMSRSFPGKYSHLLPFETSTDQVLQNYLFSIDQKFESQSFAFDWMYHKENTGLPITDFTYFNRSEESFLIGGKYEFRKDILEGKISGSIQNSKIHNDGWANIWDITSVLTKWYYSNISYKINSNLKYDFIFKGKILEYQNVEGEGDERNYSWISNGISAKVTDHNSIELGFKYLDNSKAKFECGYVFDDGTTSIKLKRRYFVTLQHETQFAIKQIQFYNNYLDLTFHSQGFHSKISTHYITYNGEKVWNVNPSVSYVKKWFLISLESNINTADSSLFSNFSKFSIKISPDLKNKPFTPILKVDGIYLQSTGKSVIDLLSPNQLSHNYEIEEFDHSTINLSFGLLFEKFEMSFNMLQLAIDNSSISPYVLPIEPINYLQVTWVFAD